MFRLTLVKALLITTVALTYLPVLILSFFVPEKDRAYFWRVCAVFFIRFVFFCSGVRVSKSGIHTEDVPTIYASNHPSEMDGFLLQMVLGAKVIPLVAPFGQFPYLVALWLKGMGAIDVIRDDIDHALYTGSNTKREALEKAVTALQDGYSLLIFPEGHTELLEALYRFHTGVARISFASQSPVQTVILKDAHKVFSNAFRPKTKTVTVEFGHLFFPEEGYNKEVLFSEHTETREKIRHMTTLLEKEILERLPLCDISEQRKDNTHIGVFVDIDLTIYRSLSQMDFLIHLKRQGHIGNRDFFRVLSLFILEKAHIISHETLMKKSLILLSGWNVTALDRLIKRFFRELALPKLEYGLFVILQDHLAKNHHIVFVTEVMHPLAQAFVTFFHADEAIDTSLTRRGLTYTGEVSLLCRDVAKKDAVQSFIHENNIDREHSYAYADSYTDIPFLRVVGNPMVIHPDTKMRRYARTHNIPILKRHL